jgi:hypothetical protein
MNDDDATGQGDRVVGGIDDIVTGDVVELVVGRARGHLHRHADGSTRHERLVPDVSGSQHVADQRLDRVDDQIGGAVVAERRCGFVRRRRRDPILGRLQRVGIRCRDGVGGR